MSVDSVTFSVLSRSLHAVAQEMSANLVRAAYSTIVREARDASVALLDVEGNVVAQAEMIAMHLGGLGTAFRMCSGHVNMGALNAGTAVVLNDPYAGAQHLNDVIVFSPIFLDGQLLGFSASVAHQLDVGGGAAAMNPFSRDVYQEGLILPPLVVNVERDWRSGWLRRIVAANVRVPEIVVGDIDAQMAANSAGTDRLLALARRYGPDVLREVMARLLDYSEELTRRELQSIPDGVYRGEDWLEDEPFRNDHLRVAATVTVFGSETVIDFTGTDPEAEGPVNCSFSSTVSAAQAALRGLFRNKDIPFNDGCNRPVDVRVPQGCLLNPRPPAPVRARMSAAHRAFDAVLDALAKAVPEQLPAQGFNATTIAALSRPRPDGAGYHITLEVLGGGYGGGPDRDGADAIDPPLTNCSNIPIEAVEIDNDLFRVESCRLIPDSGGAGYRRGGLGFERDYRILAEGVTFSGYSERFKIAPRGRRGGADGTCGAYVVERASGEIEELRSKTMATLNVGDLLRVRVGGGGGFGEPSFRERDRVREDVRAERVTVRAARKLYGLDE